MFESDNESFVGLVVDDEAVMGGFETGVVSRSKGGGKNIQIVLELDLFDDNLGLTRMLRAKAKPISDYSSQEISNAVNEMISPNTVVVTDQWTSHHGALSIQVHE